MAITHYHPTSVLIAPITEEQQSNHLTGLKLLNHEAIFADVIPGQFKNAFHAFLFADQLDSHGPGSFPG
jgi:hypothetical protein